MSHAGVRVPPFYKKAVFLVGVSFGLAARICFRMDSRQQYALGPTPLGFSSLGNKELAPSDAAKIWFIPAKLYAK